MPPAILFPLDSLDLTTVVVSREKIYKKLAQRFEFKLLDGFLHLDVPGRTSVAFHEVREDAWWVRGHIPGRPLLPGVLMIEAAAQMCSYFTASALADTRFMVFGGVDGVKFREAVAPPSRLLLLGKTVEIRPRRTVTEFHGMVDGRLVVEGRITGLPGKE